MGKYTICNDCKPMYDRDITDLSSDIAKLKTQLIKAEDIFNLKPEIKNDLVTSWNEVNEALTSLTDLSNEEIIEALSAIKERLKNAQHWLGKYVSSEDVLEDLT